MQVALLPHVPERLSEVLAPPPAAGEPAPRRDDSGARSPGDGAARIEPSAAAEGGAAEGGAAEGGAAEGGAAEGVAVFYSISAAFSGLRGVPLGGLLIKQVQQTLAAAHPQLHTFVTLSPVPGFRGWLDARLALYAAQGAAAAAGGGGRGREAGAVAGFVAAEEALALAALERALAGAGLAAADAFRRPVDDGAVRQALLRLCARYLCLSTKRRRAHDPVAAFHLRNGAELRALHWGANPSERGLRESAGIMVNYEYTPASIERNHSAYVTSGQICAAQRVWDLVGGTRAG